MGTLKEISLTYSARKEITDLDKVDISLEVKDDTFKKDGVTRPYKYVEIDNYRYTINSKSLTALKTVMQVRPQTKNVKFNKTDSGDIVVIPLD